jgi:hypothetical protein
MVASLCISSVESAQIDALLETSCPIIGSNTNTLNDSLSERAMLGQFCVSIGSTDAHLSDIMYPEPPDDELTMIGNLDLDDYMASSVDVTNTHGVSIEHISKVWQIDLSEAERTINATTQRCVRSHGDNLSRNYSTNDRMLRYRCIHQHFFMDTFFVTKKSRRSCRGHTCMQLFVTDKGFVYVVPMKSKSELSKAIKLFAKEVGAPDAIICEAAREQISQEVRTFCTKMGTALRVLEENTPWANRAELYIGIIKEAVRKDTKEADCPLAFWDYCTERRVRIHNLTANNPFQLDGQTPQFSVTGEEDDISNLCQFKWYE